ncbi:cytochrome c [Aerolutibacter ruishenii]|uniref:Cytochrome c n=1 Tax=Aerolutibacter ruishenii TaxID=686800 RepID=A0A562LYP3_9GAMM|nr:cytochrome c [Lysobacter ruishenii]TWI12777.1 cytochrome c' [Lysobacter ruishenii]
MKRVVSGFVPVVAATAILFISVACLDAHAKEKESMGLRLVMDKLGRDMQATAGAISKEDWTLVRAISSRIAGHSEPPAMEKVRILKWIGTGAGKFRTFDAQVKQGANGMADAAGRGDGAEVIRRFAEIQNACLGCHQQFRKPFVEYFYDSR